MLNSHTCFNVMDFDAAGDGLALDTRAIQQAIDTCSSVGGGTVYFPNGTYLSGTLYMRSNVKLYLEVSAVVLASPDIDQYGIDTHKQRYDLESHLDRCFIYSENVENIGFQGSGTIDGNGTAFSEPAGQRPMMMRFLNCRNIRIHGLRLRNPASWTTAFILCDTVFADALDIHSWENWNGDGLDFDSCQNVFVSNCRFNTGDDSICLQNSEKGHSCRNIVIQNCVMKSQWAGIRIGMASVGDIEDVAISNCIFHDIRCSGLKIQSAEGGHIQNIVVDNVIMRNVPRPVFLTFNHFRMGVDAPADVPRTGGIHHLQFNNMTVKNDTDQETNLFSGMVIVGTPGHPIDHITFSNVDCKFVGGGTKEQGQIRHVPELVDTRPEYFALGEALPAYAAYIRHAVGVTIRNMKVKLLQEDQRPAVVCDDVKELELDGFQAPAHPLAECFIRFENHRDACLNQIKAEGTGSALLRIEGPDSFDMALGNCRSPHVAL